MQNKTLYSLWNFSFVLWFITEFTFSRSVFAMVGLGLFCALSLMVMMVEKRVRTSNLFIYYLLFVLVCFLNIQLGHSIDKSYSIKMIVTLLRNFVFLLCAYNYTIRIGTDKLKRIFIFSSFISSFIILLIVYIKTGSIILRYEIDTINPNALAVCDAVAVCWLLSNRIKIKKHQLFLIIFFIIFTLLSGTKKALIAIILGFTIMVLLNKPNQLLKNTLFISFGLIISYAVLMYIPLFYEIIGARVESLFSLLLGGEGDASSEARSGFIELGLYYFQTNPLWGNGINCFHTLKDAYGTYSHNNFVELLFSVGIIGTISYYLMHIYILIKSFKSYLRIRTINTILSIAFIIVTIVMDIAWVSYFERSSLIYLILCLQLIASNPSRIINNTY